MRTSEDKRMTRERGVYTKSVIVLSIVPAVEKIFLTERLQRQKAEADPSRSFGMTQARDEDADVKLPLRFGGDEFVGDEGTNLVRRSASNAADGAGEGTRKAVADLEREFFNGRARAREEDAVNSYEEQIVAQLGEALALDGDESVLDGATADADSPDNSPRDMSGLRCNLSEMGSQSNL